MLAAQRSIQKIQHTDGIPRVLLYKGGTSKSILLLALFLTLVLVQLVIHGSVFRSAMQVTLLPEGEGVARVLAAPQVGQNVLSDEEEQFPQAQVPHHNNNYTARKKVSKSDYLSEAEQRLYELLTEKPSKRKPLPHFIESSSGSILYNPDAFRVGTDHHSYVNHPNRCQGVCIPTNSTTQHMLLRSKSPPTINPVLYAPKPRSPHAVLAHLFYWTHGASTTLRRFVGSLRQSGYDGHILVGFPEDGAETVDWAFLKAHHVTVYHIETEPCLHFHGNHCFKGTAELAPTWGVYAMHSAWLRDCTTCTGHVISAMEMDNVYFQTNPFPSRLLSSDETLVLAEEIAPHTNPMFHSDRAVRHTLWSLAGSPSASSTCFPQFSRLLVEQQRPVLSDGIVIGTRQSVLSYLETTIGYFYALSSQRHQDCLVAQPKVVVNYLYYSGLYDTARASTTPWGAGPVLSLGRSCTNSRAKPAHGQIDMIMLDEQGHIVNLHTRASSRLRVAPILRDFGPCIKWMQRYIDVHEQNSAPKNVVTSTEQQAVGLMVRRAINLEVANMKSGKRLLPMKTSYHRATVVKRAPWFDRQGYCLDTCCADPIAVSLHQDTDHLITSVDGFDLADVVLLGHDIKRHLVLDVSYMDDSIIPCLRDGTIFYADSEFGGIIRFYHHFRPNLTKPFVMITGRTDGPEPITGHGVGLNAIQNDDLLIRWYGINPCYSCGAKSEKFAMMHLGLSAAFDHQRYLYDYVANRNFVNPFAGANKARFLGSKELRTAQDTTNLMFVKFGINERSLHRQQPFDMACNNRTSTPNDMISCSGPTKHFHPSDIYEATKNYLFGLSPPGNVRFFYPLLLRINVPSLLCYREMTAIEHTSCCSSG